MAVNSELAALIGGEVQKQLDPFAAMMKAMEAPARRTGLSPEQYMAKVTDNGRQDGVLGPDGRFVPMSSSVQTSRTKALGWGEMWRDMAYLANPSLTREPIDDVRKRVFSPYDGPAAVSKGAGGWGMTVSKAALAEGAGVTGGYTVPPQMASQLLSIATEDAIIRPRASTQPITGAEVSVPSLDHTGTTAGASPFLGGLQGKWTSEAASRDESEPTFRQTVLKAWELSFYTLASNNLLADNGVGLDSFLTTLFGMAIEWYTEYAYLRGNGVGKPQGIIGGPATISVTRATATRIRFVDVVSMESRLLSVSDDRAFYVGHPSIKLDLYQMHDSSGNQTAFGAGRSLFVSIDQGASSKRPPAQLMGRPLYFSEKLPILGTSGDLLLVDPFFYLLGTRMEIEIAVSAHAAFRTNQMAYRVIWRGDGRSWLHGPITLADGAHTVSPFITLTT